MAGAKELRFEPLAGVAGRTFPVIDRFPFVEALTSLPLADSEILRCATLCPIAIEDNGRAPRVVLVVAPRLQARSPVDGEGRWLSAYVPIALRCLPFRRAAVGDGIEVAMELQAGAARFSALDEGGRPASAFAERVRYLDRLEVGAARLAAAARALIAADVVAPLVSIHQIRPERTLERLLFVHPGRLAVLSGPQAAALAADRLMAYELAAASLASQRLLARHLAIQDRRAAGPMAEATAGGQNRIGALDIGLDYRIDASPLFSFDAFAKGVEEEPTPAPRA